MRWVGESIGVVFGVPTIISLLQLFLQVELAPPFHMAMDYYHLVMSYIFEFLHVPLLWLAERFSFSIPDWLAQVQTLSLIGSGVGARFMDMPDTGLRQIATKFVVSTGFGYVLLGLLIVPIIVLAIVGIRAQQANTLALAWACRIAVLMVALFYAANWYLLQEAAAPETLQALALSSPALATV